MDDKYISDIEEHPDENHWAIEWGDEFGRWWQIFSNEEDFRNALSPYKTHITSTK